MVPIYCFSLLLRMRAEHYSNLGWDNALDGYIMPERLHDKGNGKEER
jgi:hypothetical protein